jgi:hypothetical protein
MLLLLVGCWSLQFSFNYISEDPKHSLKLLFKRRTDVMPPPPQVRIN